MSWEEKNIDELTEVVTKGTTPSTYGYDFIDNGVNYIRAEGISKDGYVDESTFLKVSEDCHNKLFRSQLKENDILFSIAGMALGKTGIVKEEYLPANTNQAVGIIRPIKEIVFPKFLQYYFINPFFYKTVNSVSAQSAQPNINLAQIKSLKIFLPPLQTQKRIASILSAYDDLIENNLKRIKLLEETAQNIYKEWFVNFRFPNFEHTEFDAESGLPVGWEIKKADNVYDINIGKTPPRGETQWFSLTDGIKWVSIADLNKSTVFVINTNEKITKDGVDKFNMRKASIGSVLLSFKLTVGSVAITNEEVVSNEAIAHFNLLEDSILTTEYTYQFLKNFHYPSLGSTSSIGISINSKIVKNMDIVIPNENLIKEFSKGVKNIFVQIDNLINQNQKLKEARDILLPRLMNRTIEI